MAFVTMRTLQVALIVAVGILFGASAYTFWFAQGHSYLQDDPEACINCHVMIDNYDTWMVSSHRSVVCNDCHLPHTFVRKWVSKADNGFNHALVFTLGTPDVIRAKPRSRRIIQERCLHCHAENIGFLGTAHTEDRYCFECHVTVGHAF
jgi:cytochrome c nitrite reductase small subunit